MLHLQILVVHANSMSSKPNRYSMYSHAVNASLEMTNQKPNASSKLLGSGSLNCVGFFCSCSFCELFFSFFVGSVLCDF